MKQLFLAALAMVLTTGLLAQDSTGVSPNSQMSRKMAKKNRRNNLMKMEEEGELVYNKQSIFGIRLATDGYGINYEKGIFKSQTHTLLYQFELNEKKSPKEHRISSSADGFNYSSVVLYKLNNFYEFKMAMGMQQRIGGKGNKNGVAVTAIYSGGLSIGLIKPYYIDAVDQSDPTRGTFRTTFPEFIKNDSLGNLLVSGASGFTVGWGHLSVKPGLNVKGAMRFDYGRLNQTVSAVEAGLTAEFYTSKIPQVMYVAPKQFFFNAYVSILFGSRK